MSARQTWPPSWRKSKMSNVVWGNLGSVGIGFALFAVVCLAAAAIWELRHRVEHDLELDDGEDFKDN